MLILVIDPDPPLRSVLRFILRRAGYSVVESDGTDGLRCWQEQVPALVLLEMELPGGGGWDLCAHLRASNTTPIVVLTTADWPADLERGQALGVAAYLTKPFRAAELVATIASLLPVHPPECDGLPTPLAPQADAVPSMLAPLSC